MMQVPGVKGAYGFRLIGLAADNDGLLRVPPRWPELRIVREIIAPDPGAPSPGTMEIGDESARVWIINGDRIDIDRAASEVRLATTSPLSDDAVLHPYLAFPAAVV